MTRKKTVVPASGAVPAVVPVLVVTQDVSIVMLLTMVTVYVLPLRHTPMYALWSRRRPSPARSPSSIPLSDILIVAVETGPSWRCVSVLRAAYQSGVSCGETA
jgi:hypothetical protein